MCASAIAAEHRPKRPSAASECEFLELGAGVERWLIAAASSGAQRIRSKMLRATDLAAPVGAEAVEHALDLAAAAGRFDDGDLESILDNLAARGASPSTRLAHAQATLQPGTSAWEAVGR